MSEYLHVPGGVAALLGHVLVDVRLEYVVAQLDGFLGAERGVDATHLERQVRVAVSGNIPTLRCKSVYCRESIRNNFSGFFFFWQFECHNDNPLGCASNHS